MDLDPHVHHTTVKLEEMPHAVPVHQVTRSNSLSMTHVGSMSDGLSDDPSSPESTAFDDTDLLTAPSVGMHDDVTDEVTAQLAAAGPIGMAAAAAIITGKRRKKSYHFETNPSIRKRQATRLLRKLKQLLTEYTTRVGQQACIVVCCPGKLGASFKCFGAAPLENIVKNRKNIIMEDLENALAQQAPSIPDTNPDLHELPPLVIEGIPTPVDKMTQAQLRAFIPIMLKYSTGRGKPGWGRENTKPPWWPEEVPWANVRSDVRNEMDKQKISWTNALRKVVRNCYRYHGREELLDAFASADNQMEQHNTQQTQVFTSQYPHLVHTINNADGTVSIIQVDATGAVTTLSESASQSEATQAVATLAEVAASQGEVIYGSHSMDHHSTLTHDHGGVVTSISESALHDGQLLLGDAVSAAAALVGVQDQNTAVVSIPVHAAAAMMQIQGTNLIPVSIANGGGGVQFIATSSLSNFQLQAANEQQTNAQQTVTQNRQPPSLSAQPSEDNLASMDVPMTDPSPPVSPSPPLVQEQHSANELAVHQHSTNEMTVHPNSTNEMVVHQNSTNEMTIHQQQPPNEISVPMATQAVEVATMHDQQTNSVTGT